MNLLIFKKINQKVFLIFKSRDSTVNLLISKQKTLSKRSKAAKTTAEWLKIN